jgi:transglutaminase-like putative cysteine protease
MSLSCLALLGFASLGVAQCDLSVTSLQTVDSTGAPHQPRLGEPYYMRVDFKVVGTPVGYYDIKFEMANVVYLWHVNFTAGNYYGYVGWNLPLDSKFPIKITLDSGGTQNDTDRSNNVAAKSVRPTLPLNVFTYYGAQTIYNKHTASVTMGATSNWSRLLMITGVPVTETSQTVKKLKFLSGTQFATNPTGYPGIRLDVPNPTPGATYKLQQTSTIRASNCKLNANKVADAWTDFTNLPVDVQYWVQPESAIPSLDPAVTAFVERSLPRNFKNKQTPIQAARALFLAVVKELNYVTPAPFNPVTVLTNHYGDCGGFTALYVASLRNVGIPARMRSGFLIGVNNYHVWPEIYMPSIGWIPQDPTFSDGIDATGTYPYFFGIMPDLNSRVSIGIGNTFTDPSTGLTLSLFQTFGYWGWWTNRGSETTSIDVDVSTSPIP